MKATELYAAMTNPTVAFRIETYYGIWMDLRVLATGVANHPSRARSF